MNIINLTAHPITIRPDNGPEVIYPPSGTVARIQSESTEVALVNGIPVVQNHFGKVDGLPAYDVETVYIVSTMVAQANTGRYDLVSPDTGPTAYREAGQIVAVRRFQCFYWNATNNVTHKNHIAELIAQGWTEYTFFSEYYGSHPECGERDIEQKYIFAPGVVPPALPEGESHWSHGHRGDHNEAWHVWFEALREGVDYCEAD